MPQTVLCPACEGRVRVAEGSAGQEVVCPKCQSSFAVPVIATDDSDEDDDWLTLKDDPPPARRQEPAPTAPRTPAPATAKTQSKAAAADLMDDLPEFSLAPEAPRRPASTTIAWDDVEDDDDEPPPVPVATDAQFERNYVASCSTCGSRIDVTADQAGRQIRCPDCHAAVRVPPAPKVRVKRGPAEIEKPSLKMQGYNDGPAKTRDDPFRRSADELLRTAEALPDEDESDPYADPDIAGWFNANFGVFRQLGVMVHAGLLIVIGSAAAIGILVGGGEQLSGILLYPFAVLFAVTLLTFGFTILQSVSNSEESIQDWPSILNPADWFESVFLCLAAAAMAGAPGALLGAFWLGQSIATTAIIMFCVFALFPIILLSMLDMQSVTSPFSPEVTRSFRKGSEFWGVFYVTSAGLFIAVLVLFAVAVQMPEVPGTAIIMATIVLGTFLYFAMLGNLARQISLTVNDQ